MNAILRVNKNILIAIMGIVWIIAGANVFYIGIEAYKDNVNIVNIFMSFIIFILFGAMFFKMLRKHIKRIVKYKNEKYNILKAFDRNTYIVIIFMMTMGIVIRKYALIPIKYVGIIYISIGLALFICGLHANIFFIKIYFKNYDILKRWKD